MKQRPANPSSAPRRFKPGDRLVLSFEEVAEDGSCVAYEGALEVRVAEMVLGCKGYVEIDHVSPHRPIAWGRVLDSRIIAAATPPRELCVAAMQGAVRCGGCPLLPMPEAEGVELKVRWLHGALASIGATPVLERRGPSLGYRNRNIYHVVADIDGMPMLGSRVPQGAELADMVPCVAVLPAIDAAAHRFVRELYEAPQSDWPRYLILRGNRAGEVVGELIFGRALVEAPAWTEELEERLGWAGWGWSVNEDPGDAVRRGEPTWVAGAATVMERYGQLDLPVGTSGFAQLNAAAAGAMYEIAGGWLRGAETVWDLYCGMGAIGLHGLLLGGVKQLFGAESSETSIASAKVIAAGLALPATFEVMSAAQAFAAGWPRPDAVVVNPPRKGLEPAVLAALLAAAPERVVYMSCSPDSFARDASRLMSGGYKLEEVSAHDLLPQTRHAELLARFSRTVSP